MSVRVLLLPLSRASVIATFSAMALVALAFKLLEIKVSDPQFQGHAPLLIFVVVYHVLVVGLLISFGSFLARVAAELEGIRISRTAPGLRRKVNEGMLILTLLIPALGTFFLQVNVPGQFAKVPTPTQWALHVFLFSLGLALGRSWLIFAVITAILSKIQWLLLQFRAEPWLTAELSLLAAGLLLAFRHHRFLAPISKGKKLAMAWNWLNSPFSSLPFAARPINQVLRDRPDWRLPNSSVFSLLCAGSLERLGHRRGTQLGALTKWVAYTFLIFGLLIFSASRGASSIVDFIVELFTKDQPTQGVSVLRHIFGALAGGVAYVAAVTLDGTLRPSLWHPVSRRRLGVTVFLAHLRQNFGFAVILAAVSCGLVAVISRAANSMPNMGVIRAFSLPALFAFMLMPIPQALFPNGPDAFHRRVNPLKQLVAGLLGGGISLLTVYWTSFWPLKAWHDWMPLWTRAALMVTVIVAVYCTYFVWLRHRYARIDLRPRIG